jgi:thioredoxin-dependent peroxiredoxin
MRKMAVTRLMLAAALVAAARAGAQQTGAAPAAAASTTPMPAVGDKAPDFAFKGLTRYGALRDSIRLTDFAGHTVVLAFFPAARTKG